MSEILDSQLLQFHCFTDGKDHHLPRAKKIECNDGHQLSYDFPNDGYWNYCCTCERFSLSEISENNKREDHPVCRNCERMIVRRSLCNKCKMITIETNGLKEPKSFTLSSSGAPSPQCPGCLKPTTESLSEHYCAIATFDYLTARSNCPFCDKSIGPSAVHETIFPEPDGLGEAERVRLDPAASADSHNKAEDGFHFLEWVSKSSAASSHLGLVVGVISVVLAIVALLIVLVPPALTSISWRLAKFRNNPPLLGPIVCEKTVVAGKDLLLTAHANDIDGEQLKFAWAIVLNSESEKAGRIETISESGNEAVFHADGIFPLGDPVKVTIQLVVSDKYESLPPQLKDITILQRQNHPPFIKESPQCMSGCVNSEVRAGGSFSISAFATDEDEDDNENLIYSWQSSIPTIPITKVDSNHGSTVILNTSGMDPQSSGAPLKVTLTVTDGHSRPEWREITITVLPKQVPRKFGEAPLPVQQINHPPRFERFSVSKSLVEEGESVELRAFVIDPDGNTPLFYKWTTSAGAIQNNDDTATLNTTGVRASEVEVTLTVSDSSGRPTALRTSITVRPRSVKTPLPSPNAPSTPATKPLLFIPRTAIWQMGALGPSFFRQPTP